MDTDGPTKKLRIQLSPKEATDAKAAANAADLRLKISHASAETLDELEEQAEHPADKRVFRGERIRRLTARALGIPPIQPFDLPDDGSTGD